MESSFPGQSRLLMPMVRSPVPPPLPQSPPSPPTRRPTSKLTNSRSGSATAIMQSAAFNEGATRASQYHVGELWIGIKSRFEIDEGRVELQGYQIYAVEKWIVERRPVTVLTVYTGDPTHKIIVTVLKPAAHLTPREVDAELKLSVQQLRKDGARLKQTPLGVLMVTSLANFRSDYTIVQIPNGDFLAAQDRLYCNINLLRMGCSGRSAVTLEDPSETTKDRFKSLYLIPDAPSATQTFRSKSPHSRAQNRTFSHTANALVIPDEPSSSKSTSPQHSVSNINAQQSQRHPHFVAAVLELVKLIQAALSVCGMFSLTSRLMFDGLLCDVTINGLQKWMVEVGESLPDVEATERILDPTEVSALLSFVLSARNKLASFTQAVPKDPFLYPHAFIASISTYAQLVCTGSHLYGGMHSTPLLPHAGLVSPTASGSSLPGPGLISPTISSYSHLSSIGVGGSTIQPTTPTYLNHALYTVLMSTHEAKIKHSDSRRVQRIILSSLDPTSERGSSDEERRGLSGRVRGFVGRGGVAGAGGILSPIADLGTFIRAVIGRDKLHDRVGSRAEKKSERERIKKDEKPDEVDEKERIAGSLRALWTGRVEIAVRMRARAAGPTSHQTQVKEEKDHDKERLTSSDVDEPGIVKSAGEDDIDLTFGGAWSGKVQKKLEFWAGINRSKRSIDLSSPLRSAVRSSLPTVPLSAESSLSGLVCTDPSVGPAVPSVILSPNNEDEEDPLSSGQVSPISIPRTSNSFMLNPSANASHNLAQGSTSNLNRDDPEYDRRVKSFLARQPKRRRDESRVSSWSGVGSLEEHKQPAHKSTEGESEAESKRRMLRCSIQRRHSFHDLYSFRDLRVLRPEWMRIDVDLCGHLLIMHRREELLRDMIGCAAHMCSRLATSNEALQQDYNNHHEFLSNLSSHPESLQRVEAARAAAYANRQQVAALEYEAGQFRRQDLWEAAIAPRAKVLELRNKVFGSDAVGSRKRRGMQWTLGGETREVDAWGRTDSEEEEERRAGAGLGDLRVLREDTEDEMSEAEGEDEHTAVLTQPMWLLKFLTSWTARLGFLSGQGAAQVQPSQPNMQSESSVPTTGSLIISGASISSSPT